MRNNFLIHPEKQNFETSAIFYIKTTFIPNQFIQVYIISSCSTWLSISSLINTAASQLEFLKSWLNTLAWSQSCLYHQKPVRNSIWHNPFPWGSETVFLCWRWRTLLVLDCKCFQGHIRLKQKAGGRWQKTYNSCG